MQNPLSDLGLLLMSILLTVALVASVIVMGDDKSAFTVIALGIVLVIVVLTFISYLVIDLYRSVNDDEAIRH